MLTQFEDPYHPLIQKQLATIANTGLLQNQQFQQFVKAVNQAYKTYENDKHLSQQANTAYQLNLAETNKKLKEEFELKKLYINKLKHTLNNISPDEDTVTIDNDNDLLEIVDLLNGEIKKRKEVEQQLLLAKEEAEHASMAKTEFLSVMSHEIRTPLNAVIGMGHLLIKNNPREDQSINLNALKKSADHLLLLINDILDFNKIESGNLNIEDSVFCLKNLINDIVTAHTISASERENTLVVHLYSTMPDFFIGDPLRIGQVLTNLISNAIKFSRKGTITINAAVTELVNNKALVKFSIQDTGVGITEEKLASIFLPFTQASSSITRQFGGTGLGLAITKRILNMLNTTIHVTSQLGVGSTFYFTLPLEAVDTDEANNATELTFNLQQKRILLVEDTYFNILFATQLLESWHAVVDVAENGLIATEKIKETAFDLVLMDLQMPVMDGYTASKKIREFNTTIPIVALTASATANVREKVLAVGMQDYVTKPFNPDDFFIKLKKYLG
jgi:signal transduction histidine kinase/CheY-like chemotaxis protein